MTAKVQTSTVIARFAAPIAIAVIVFGGFAIYAPGRYGPFLLDDMPNLIGLAQVGTLDNIDGVIRFVFSDISGTPDRWLSKLSFLINDTTWPTDAFSFKHTNILLHLINGLLIIWMILRLMRIMRQPEHICQIVAIFSGALWVLHPLNVSTTLYVIQRMTEMAALFNLVGILLYLKGREVLAGSPKRGYFWMTTGMLLGTCLGFLSKENGALLPLYVLALEALLLRNIGANAAFRYWKWLFLYMPIVALIVWHISALPAWLQTYALRPFDLPERLLTEARVLVDYLKAVLAPVRTGTGVFHDDYSISRSLLQPPSTLVAIFILAGLMTVAFFARRTQPVLSFGIAWFFAGHVIESGIVPLELYFEHRNYLPMVGPLFAVCYFVGVNQTRLKVFLHGGLLLCLSLTAFSTWQNVRIWGSTITNVVVWEQEHPTSLRAIYYASNFYARYGFYEKAGKLLTRITQLEPDWAGPELQMLLISCHSGADGPDPDTSELVDRLATATWDPAATTIVSNLAKSIQEGTCTVLGLDHVNQIVDALLDNPSYLAHKADIANLLSTKALIDRHLGNDLEQARRLRESFSWKTNWHVAVQEATVWAALKEYDRALEAIDRAKSEYFIALLGFKIKFESDELNSWRQHIVELKQAHKQETVE